MKNLSYLLTALFIGLKITNQIEWSWFVVLSPLLIGFLLHWFFASVFIFLGNLAGEANEKRKERQTLKLQESLRSFADEQLKKNVGEKS
jgi:hypothetical protein